ncbi:type IV pilus biogenesis/stability protein PilW [Parasulfuritortus cantonensis]|uniref:Type IV pilus biogenesis/stability protein PilW n=1 Tax=Parasulfuritortus cantonensis TaxID=2528202 RepID=A0A4V2NWL9_9PROT|nr:type IV pilus biogenesis/stability protein PilW [Parasulfuritortus cantonensis]TCJ17912.1 type IV pilus biogenesis/stability protein PilW [Parasulfuritortus cantonensis]
MKTGWFSLFVAIVLGGCAAQPGTQPAGQDSAAMESASPRARVHTELAALYYTRRQFAISLQELQEALQADGAYAPAYNMSGLVHAELLEDKQAEADFLRSLELAPQYAEAHNNYGYFLCTRKRRDEAMAQYELAWKNPLYPTPERALANAGLCALRAGNLDEAENYAKRALVRAEYQPQATLVMAEIHLRRGNAPMARSLLRQVEAHGGLDAGALWLAVKVERASGNREAEASYGLQLRRSYPEAPETAWLLNSQYDMPGDRP